MRSARRPGRAFVLFAVLLLASLPGCWSRKEIDSLGYVTIAGVDLSPESGGVILTVHIAKPFAIRTAQANGQGGQEQPCWLVSVRDDTMTSAARELFFMSPRRPFWGHCRLVVVGEELARHGLGDVLDWFERNGPIGRMPQLVLVKGADAWQLLQAEFVLERMPTQGYIGILESTSRLLSRMRDCSIIEVVRQLEEEGREAVIPAFEILPLAGAGRSPGELTRTQVELAARLAGEGVLREDRLVGWLDLSEARLLGLIEGQQESDFLEFPDPEDPGKVVSVQIVRSEGRVELVEGDEPSFRIRLRVFGRVTGVQREFAPVESPEQWPKLEEAFAGYLKGEVERLVSRMQSLGSDVFGFGAVLHRKEPQQWEYTRDKWNELFRTLRVEAEVEATLHGPGIMLRNIRIR